MPAFKLSTAASLCSHPYKWARSITTTTTNPSLPLNSSGWRITPCAHLKLTAHDKLFNAFSITTNNIININNNNNNITKSNKNLGFVTFCNHKCFSTSSSSENSGGIAGSSESSSSPSSSSVDMGSENTKASDNSDVWYHNDHNLLRQNQNQNQPPSPLPSPSMPHQQHSSSKFLTLPTILTLGRVAAVPLLISTFYVDSWWGRTATTSIFIAAAITDWLDGYIARKMRLGSAFGAFLDPVADKLMVAATLVLLCTRPLEVAMLGQVPWLLTVPAIAIIGREITMSAVREWAASQNSKLLEAVAVNNLGKWKTATQMIALTILLATRDGSLGGPGILVASGVFLLYISAGLSLWSLAVYMGKIWKVLLK